MKTRYQSNRCVNAPLTIASLFIAVSLIVSGCSNTLPTVVITPNQTVSNTTLPEPAAVPNTTPNATPVAPPPPTTPVVTPPTTPTPNTTPIPPPPPPVATPNATQNTTPEPPPTANATQNATPVSYAKIQIIFNNFCASPDCHDGTGNNSLNLKPAFSYKLLVNVTSDFLKDKMRVKPGAPAQSVIMIMITDPQHCTIPQSAIDFINQWILEGALNN